jgi:phage tail sheath protein FI
MPAALTYPGVYVEEQPTGGARAIVAVPTSITAFVGAAPRGDINVPVTITSFTGYERAFGPLDSANPLSLAVFAFFLNGGGQAIVVRAAAADGVAAGLKLDDDVLLKASSPGTWGNKLRARVTFPADGSATHYNLEVLDGSTGQTEQFTNISITPGAGVTLDQAVAASRLVRADPASKLTVRPDASAVPAPGQNPWDDAHSTKSDAAGKDPGPAMPGDETTRTGIYALLGTDIFNLLCVFAPEGAADAAVSNINAQAAALCVARRAFLILDAPWSTVVAATAGIEGVRSSLGSNAKSTAMYFQDVSIPDPTSGAPLTVGPSGSVAGLYARTDSARGVWKAPAGTETSLNGVLSLTTDLQDGDQGQLNPLGLNCLRRFPGVGIVSWGARTMRGSDRVVDDPSWKYVPIRRTALFIEESLYRGTQFVVFEPNDEPLWSAVRLTVGAFMNTLFRQGAFQGSTPAAAYLVQCDADNNPQEDIDRGILNILVGFAPLKPAEFVILHIQQLAGQSQG